MNSYKRTLALLSAAALAGCSYEKNTVQDITAPGVTGANVKFFNFGVNTPGLNFFANDAKVTAVSSTSCSPAPTTANPLCTTTGAESTTGTAVGGAANGGLYNVVPSGSVAFAGKISATADNGLAVASTTASLETGKYYSFFTSGVYDATAKKVESFVVEDAFPAAIDFTVAYVRFVNTISNSSPMTLYAKNTTTSVEAPVGGAIAYKAGGAFVAVPAGTYDLATRVTGSATNTITRAAVGFAAGRAYTIGARGTIGGTGTAVPALDNTANR
jgi:hypothetical protein